jgi:hypothetical protein
MASRSSLFSEKSDGLDVSTKVTHLEQKTRNSAFKFTDGKKALKGGK